MSFAAERRKPRRDVDKHANTSLTALRRQLRNRTDQSFDRALDDRRALIRARAGGRRLPPADVLAKLERLSSRVGDAVVRNAFAAWRRETVAPRRALAVALLDLVLRRRDRARRRVAWRRLRLCAVEARLQGVVALALSNRALLARRGVFQRVLVGVAPRALRRRFDAWRGMRLIR